MSGVYQATWDSVRTHKVPDWYNDAKLGVFIHWGLDSVPGWAPRVPDVQELLVRRGPKQMLRENPYAEWYLNTMQIEASSTRRHHLQAYGEDFSYDNFITGFCVPRRRPTSMPLLHYVTRPGLVTSS